MEQTAVEWLVEELQEADYIPKDSLIMKYVIEQAKELQKQQIIEFAKKTRYISDDIEQYYNETFNNK